MLPRVQPVLTILRAHDFPPTTLRFSPDASLLISGSADNTIRIIVVPENFESCEFHLQAAFTRLLICPCDNSLDNDYDYHDDTARFDAGHCPEARRDILIIINAILYRLESLGLEIVI
jgi:WD40 repeat protein